MWEEVASGGAIGLVGTLLGIWVAHVLQQRSIEAEKVERAAKLHELLAGEIMTNTGQILTGPEIDKLTDTNELPRSMNQPYLACTVFEMGRSDLSSYLPSWSRRF